MKYLSFIIAIGCLLVAPLPFFISGCHAPGSEKSAGPTSDSTYSLTGDVEGLDSGWVYLLHRQSGNDRMDSALIRDGQFVFTGTAKVPEFCNLGAAPNGTREFYCGFFLQNGKLNLIGRKAQLTDAQVFITGSPAEDDYKEFLEGKRKIDSVNNLLQQYYGYARAKKDQHLVDSLIPLLYTQYDGQRQWVKNFARVYPASYVSPFVVYTSLANDPGPGELDSLYKGFTAEIQGSFFGRMLKKAMDLANKTAIGSPAPDFTLADTHDKPVALASFKGKYTLVDFWASWCGPCRAENPNVVKAYRKYHPKGFAILGVSLDQQKSNWEKAIKKDKLAWTQVSDLKGWESSAAALYGVTAIPMNFLLDKEGKIVGKGLRGKALEDKLAEAMK
jgi:peroxiredoxin